MLEFFVRFGELGLKSPPVRRYMEIRLAENIRSILKKIDIEKPDVKINRSWGRLIITLEAPSDESEKEQIIEKIQSTVSNFVMGVTSISLVHRTSCKIEDIGNVALALAKKVLKPNSTFAVRARRVGTHNYTSKDLERLIGEVIFEALKDELNLSVNLTEPMTKISIEVRDNFAFIFSEKHESQGGLPQGTQGTIAAILRGSIEDAIASFLLCKRGAIVSPIAFVYTNGEFENNKTAINEQLRLFEFIQPRKANYHYIVDFSKILNEVTMSRLQCSICDKICLKIAEIIMQDKMIGGISFGNASTTLMDRIPEKGFQNNIPIYYPLLALNKEKIKHPFNTNYKSEFCLSSCLGFENQKEKEIKPLSNKEISLIAANANFQLIKPTKS